MSWQSAIPDRSKLPKKQRMLADVLRLQPEVFAFGNLRTLQRMLDVSGITVIRFAKRLGFTGFQELQEAVRHDYLSRAGFGGESPEEIGSEGSLVERTMRQQRTSLETLLSSVREEELLRIARTLVGARRILAAGAGSSGIVARLLVRLLRHVGLRGEYVDEAGVDSVIALHDVTSEDVVVVASLWLNFDGAVRILRMADRAGATTIAMVGGNGSALAAMADAYLYAPGHGAAMTFSLTAHVALVECLIAAIASLRPEEVAATRAKLHDMYVQEGLIASQDDVAAPSDDE